MADLGPEIVGVIGTLAGVVLGVLSTWQLERARWAREERTRWLEDRRNAYVSLLQVSDELSLTLRRAVGADTALRKSLLEVLTAEATPGIDPENLREIQDDSRRKIEASTSVSTLLSERISAFFRAQAEVGLFGSDQVSDAALALALVGQTGMDLWIEGRDDDSAEWSSFEVSWGKVRAAFSKAARTNLNITND